MPNSVSGEVIRGQIYSILTTEYIRNEKNFPILRKILECNTQGILDVLNLTINKLKEDQIQRLIEILFKITKVSNIQSNVMVLKWGTYSQGP